MNSNGKNAYEMKVGKDITWLQVANELNYHPEWPNIQREHRIITAAKQHAHTHKKPWPIVKQQPNSVI